jgi:glycine C-acetyltransferase
LLNGKISIHEELEEAISSFKGIPQTHLFLNAWMAMKGFMESFCHLAMKVPGFEHSQRTLILTDIQNHGCITSAVVDTKGGKVSGQIFGRSQEVCFRSYRHCDPESLSRVY